MDAFERCTNLEKKNLADSIASYGRGREIFRPPTYKHLLHHGTNSCSPA